MKFEDDTGLLISNFNIDPVLVDQNYTLLDKRNLIGTLDVGTLHQYRIIGAYSICVTEFGVQIE